MYLHVKPCTAMYSHVSPTLNPANQSNKHLLTSLCFILNMIDMIDRVYVGTVSAQDAISASWFMVRLNRGLNGIERRCSTYFIPSKLTFFVLIFSKFLCIHLWCTLSRYFFNWWPRIRHHRVMVFDLHSRNSVFNNDNFYNRYARHDQAGGVLVRSRPLQLCTA